MGLIVDLIYVLSELKKLVIVVATSPFAFIAGGLMYLSGGASDQF